MSEELYKTRLESAVSFSGGRTSAYMLYRILDAYNGKLPDNIKVLFANTGKEMPQTLDFVRDCSVNWGVDIVWVELESIEIERGVTANNNAKNVLHKTFKVVDYNTASRAGEPFDAYLNAIDAIPNAVRRSCTGNLKIRPMKWYLQTHCGYESPWMQYVGIRADEQRRAVKIHGTEEDGHERYCPLWLDGITAHDVGEFWRQHSFDLQLPNNDGVTDWGNCDLCFLKAKSKRLSIIRERPDLADWWIDAEERKGQQFRPGEPSYRNMAIIAKEQHTLFDLVPDETIPCFCGD